MEERFWSRVEKGDGCWLWTGCCVKDGYGMIGYGNSTGKYTKAHRYSWELANGRPVPPDKSVLHDCDVRACVNPAHLHLGTPMDNMREMHERGRARPARGPEHHRAVFTESDVIDIRTLVALGARQVDLARAYGVRPPTINAVVLRKVWKHVP